MLQSILFSVYFENFYSLIQNSYFYIDQIRSDQFLAYYVEPPQISFFTYYIWGPLRSVSSLTIRGPPSDQFICILFRGPSQISFFACYIRPLRSLFWLVSALTIWGLISSVSLHTIWKPPYINFFAYYMGPPLDQFLCILFGGPFRSVSSLIIWAPHRSISLHTGIMNPLRSVSSQNIWGGGGGPQFRFFAYYMGPPGQFLCLLYGGPSGQFLRLLCAPPPRWPQISFFEYYIGDPFRSVSLYSI